MSGKEHFSLLVVTTDRVASVRRLFTSLCAQTYREFSLVFVFEDKCEQEALALAGEFSAHFPILPITTSCCGVSRARNIGIPHLTGEYIAFPDDDCIYHPETLERAAYMFSRHPEVDAFLGRRLNPGTMPGTRKMGGKVRPLGLYFLFHCSETFLQFYRRACVDALGDWDEMLGGGTQYPYGCGEDTDYVLRAHLKGCNVVRAPAVGVEHPSVNYDHPQLLQKTASYAHGRMFLLRKHQLPLWFRLANVIYPLFCLPAEFIRHGGKGAAYRWRMFLSRAKHLAVTNEE